MSDYITAIVSWMLVMSVAFVWIVSESIELAVVVGMVVAIFHLWMINDTIDRNLNDG